MNLHDQLVTRALDEVNRHAGLFFKDVRLTGAVETIEDWIAEHGIANPVDIGPGVALDALLEDLVVHESYFDRDIEQLKLVDELVLARLARTTDSIKVWSAGCASGEEPYTLAMLLAVRAIAWGIGAALALSGISMLVLDDPAVLIASGVAVLAAMAVPYSGEAG